MIEELQEDINILITAINDGKHGIIHPQLLMPQMLIDTINEYETVHRTRYHFDANPESYQHIIGISEINVAIIKKSLTHIVDIPVLEKEEYTINHVIPIPKKIQNTHIAIIPDHEYLFKFETGYVPTDSETLNTCKNLADYKICHRNQPDYRLIDTHNCDASIIRKNQHDVNCDSSPFKLHSESYIQTSRGYIILPTKKTVLDFLCKDAMTTVEIIENVLIQGSECKISISNVQLYLEKTTEFKKNCVFNKTYTIPYDKNSFEILKDHLITLPDK